MYRKMIFIFFTILSNISNREKTVILLLISSFSLYETLKYKPFILSSLNKLEIYSNFAALVSIFAGSLYVLEVSNEIKAITFCVIILRNTTFTIKWIISVFDIIMTTFSSKIFRCCPKLIEFYAIFKKSRDETPFSLFYLCSLFQNCKKNSVEYEMINC